MSHDDLVVTFAEVERASVALRSHAESIRGFIYEVGSTAANGDLLASAPISLATFASVESSIGNAVAQLTMVVGHAESVATVSATIVTTYQLAESSLAACAERLASVASSAGDFASNTFDVALRASAMAESGVVLFGSVVVLLDVAMFSIASGFTLELAESLLEGLQKTVDALVENPALLVGGVDLLAALVGANAVRSFSVDDAFSNTVRFLEGSIGITGPLYDDILGALIAHGNTWGWFHDTEAVLIDCPFTEEQLKERADGAIDESLALLGEAVGPERWETDMGRIIPRDLATLLIGASQIDSIGGTEAAVIRIARIVGDDGECRFVVQIPSTLEWDPSGGNVPNDLTSDLSTLMAGERSALAKVVTDAMAEAGVGDSPVMISGFSLGGIVAAAIAAESRFNVKHLVTAGAPIGRTSIPDSVSVTSLEASQDLVTALDGKPNRSAPNRYTITGPAPSFPGKAEAIDPLAAHNANRYALMAQSHQGLGNTDDVGDFLKGTATVTDMYAVRGER